MSCWPILDIGQGPIYASGAMQRKKIPNALCFAGSAGSALEQFPGADGCATRCDRYLCLAVLIFSAAVLFVILSILMIDLHRDELRALGLVGGAERINPVFMSP